MIIYFFSTYKFGVFGMSLARLESDLLKVKRELDSVKNVNSNFEKVIDQFSILRSKTITHPETKQGIIEELKHKEIIDLFSSIQNDFDKIKAQINKQELAKEKVFDFVESLRTKKSFNFSDTSETIIFLEEVIDYLDSEHISIRPEFLGTVDLGIIAVELGLHKSASSVIVEKERLGDFLSLALRRKLLRNLIFETDNAKIFLKNSTELVVESDNTQIKGIIRLSKR